MEGIKNGKSKEIFDFLILLLFYVFLTTHITTYIGDYKKMAKFPEANARLYKNVFVCKDCKAKTRAQHMKVLQGKIACRKCGSKALRQVRMK